jgi:hypothetical protein
MQNKAINSPGSELLQERGDSTDGVFLLTSRPPWIFLAPGELHLAVKVNYRLAIRSNALTEIRCNQCANTGP